MKGKALPPSPNIGEFDKFPEGHEMFTVMASYGDKAVLHASSIHLTPSEASDLVKTICQLIIGIQQLREGEQP